MLPQVEFALNCKVSSSTKFSLAELVFGLQLVNPIEVVRGVYNIFHMSFYIYNYLVGFSRVLLILLLQVTTRSMRLRVLLSTRRQKVGLCISLDGRI